MLYEKKYYGNGHGNFDDADFVLQPNEWVNLENARVGSTDKGVIGTVESVGSNQLLSSIQPSVTFVQIGSTVDEENNRIIYFLKDLYGPWDKIVCFDISGQTFYDVLLANQVTGGLNFSKDYVIHSAKVINGLLYWTDNLNPPRKINIDAGIKLNQPSFPTSTIPYTSPIDWSEITLIRRPPAYPPFIAKNYDSSFANNFIANESFRFAFQYVYYDNETSVVGTYAAGTRLNTVTDDFNRVIVTMNFAEDIPQTVRIVNLIVRINNSAFIVNTWDKDIASEAAEIAAHNANTTALTYNFYNNITGQAIASDLVLKPFDSIPILTQTLEIARNRLLLGNNLSGYDAPGETSLTNSLTTIDLNGSTLEKNLYSFESAGPSSFTRDAYSGWYVYLTELSPVGFYALVSTEQICDTGFCPVPPLPPAPTTVGLAGLAFRGTDLDDVIHNPTTGVEVTYGLTLFFRSNALTGNLVEITGLSVSTYNIVKSQSQYKIGVVFYDYAMRKCGVVTPPFDSSTTDPTLANIPGRTFSMSTAVNVINWFLSNANAVNEIPDWAYYYTVVITLNLRTRFFVQAVQQTSNAKYVTKDADGNYEFTQSTFVSGAVGIGLDATSLTQAGLGYTFNEGDVCILIKDDDTTYTLSVIDQSGKYIIVNVPEGGIGDFTSFQMIYELYTPYQSSEQEPFYEAGTMYPILNPGTDQRQYAFTSSSFAPDVYALTRNYDSVTYFAETMSPNDRFWQRWDNDTGKVNYIVKSGQVRKPEFFSYSNTYIPGTATNGLSTFEALNERNVPSENGAIQRLILTSKTQDEGTVLLAICSNETTSIYLGETRVLDNTGTTQFLASSSDFVGTINNLKGSFGTSNPESVIEFRGNVYWVDVLNGKVVQYSLNGLFPISNYKMTRYWKQFCDQYLSMTPQAIEALGSRPFIFAAVDPYHWELLITVPRVLQNPPMGYLPDAPYTAYVYPFDIWDGQAKTLVYKLNSEPNYWMGSFSQTPEGWITVQNKLYSFKYGQLYENNNTDSYCNFYGTQYKSRIMGVCNQQPERVKVYNNLSIEANMLPTLTYFMCLAPYAQVSNLQDFDYQDKEGVLYCQIYRNILTPTATGLKVNGLVTGEKMRTYAFRFMIEFTVSTTPIELRFVNFGYQLSLGHSIPVQ